MHKKILSEAIRLCHNGTHSCQLQELMRTTGATQAQVMNALDKATFNVRIARNINHLPLIVIDEEDLK